MSDTLSQTKCEWKETTLGEVINLRRGHDLPKQKRVKGVIPIISSSGITGYHNEHKAVGPGVVTGRYGTIGQVFYVKGQYWPLNTTLYVDDFKGNVPLFVSYFLRSIDFDKYNDKSTVPGINRNHIHLEEVSIPPIEEQTAIASILSSLDDKIDLLHRQNQTLEQMAETLFREWFVENADDGWEVGTLNDVLTVKGGTTPSTKNPDYWNGNIHWTSPRDITTLNSIYLFDTERKITEAGLRKISSGLLPNGTLLMSSRAPVGVLAFAEVPIAINQGYIAILDDKGFTKEFLFLWLKTNMDYVKSYANGSTFLEISKSAFKSLEIQIPPQELRNEFQEWVTPHFRKIKSNQTQIRTLTALRDTLLPKLMSGEVRVKMN